MRARMKRMSLKAFYLLSPFAVALIACSAVGILLYIGAMSALERQSREQIEDKVHTLAENVARQYEAMEKVSLEIAVNPLYRYSTLNTSAYNDVKLLEDFTKYNGYSQMTGSYFLLYNDETRVYKSTGRTNSFDFFMDSNAFQGDPQNLYGQLQSAAAFNALPVTVGGSPTALFVFPVYTMGRSSASGHATLSFLVSPSALRGYIRRLVGDLDGRIDVYWDGHYLLNAQDSLGGAMPRADALPEEAVQFLPEGYTRYAAASVDSSFQVVYTAPPGRTAGGGHRFLVINIAYLCIVILIILVLSAAIGYYNYRPIRRLIQRCLGTDKKLSSSNKNEIENVGFFLDSLLTEKKHIEEDLRQQYTLIKKQILKLLLAGDSLYLKLVRESFMGIDLSGPYYMAVAMETETLPDAAAGELAAYTEGLSRNDLRFYFAETSSPRRFAIFVNLPGDDMAGEALDNIQTLFSEIISCRIGASQPFADIAKISDAFSQALAKCASPNEYADKSAAELFWYDAALAADVIAAIAAMDYKAASAGLRAFMDAAARNTKHIAYERYSYLRLLEEIECGIGDTDKSGMALDNQIIDRIVASKDRLETRQNFHTLISRLCSKEADDGSVQPEDRVGKTAEKGRARTEKLLAYINDNYTDKNMSLEKLTERFGYSNRFISKIIKDETGQSYKDYLIELRIHKAQELLSKERITVTEVCDHVGFTYLPHFVQTFRRITGYTPGKYMENTLQEKTI